MSGNVWNRLLWSCMVDAGTLSNNMKFSPDFYITFQEHDRMQWRPSLIRNYTNSRPCYRSGPYCWVWRFYQIPKGFHRIFTLVATCEHMTLTPSWYLVLSHLGLVYVLMLRHVYPKLYFCIDQLVMTVIICVKPVPDQHYHFAYYHCFYVVRCTCPILSRSARSHIDTVVECTSSVSRRPSSKSRPIFHNRPFNLFFSVIVSMPVWKLIFH